MVASLVELGIAIIALVSIFIGLTLGLGSSSLNKLAVVGIGLFLGSVLWLLALMFSGLLSSIPFFLNLAGVVSSLPYGTLVFGNSALTTVLLLILILEIGYFVGYGLGQLRFRSHQSDLDEFPFTVPVVGGATVMGGQSEFKSPYSRTSANTSTLLSPKYSGFPAKSAGEAYELGSSLGDDERTIATLLAVNRMSEIVPSLDESRPEGYSFPQLKMLDWNASRISTALNSLSSRGYLIAVPKEKMLHCQKCNSTSLQFTSVCPECNSLHLSKHRVLEHFSCGMVDQEEKFRSHGGELLCPKCNKTLDVIGADYRSLGMMYVCQDCGSLNKELMSNLKCRKCGFATPPEQENEEIVFGYKINDLMLPRLRLFVKPTELISRHLTSLGYSVFSPASVRGKSGTEHTFDILAIAYGERNPKSQYQFDSETSKRFAIEILTSDGASRPEDVKRVYLKEADISYPCLLVVIPSLSDSARDFVRSNVMSVLEVHSAEEIVPKLQKSITQMLQLKESNQRLATTSVAKSASQIKSN